MKITLLQVGKTEESYLLEGIAIYETRLKKYVHFQTIQVPASKLSGSQKNTDVIKKKEGEEILSKVQPSDFFMLLDERGKKYSSREFAQFLQQENNKATKHIVFCIGGAYGFSPEVYQRANAMVSLSQFTFPHQLVRLIFAEQLYRVHTILKNEPYHHD
ncbi:MAG: 23S rRNA (pseudouridine(1915)-N(3))-methyltransferase RlmH [Cytophagaceae bacterium]|jgi:23S rRNA (pseudouridine1915-N3)-methyltransferase|nr:23S rRNA (pseudouridine(1915)-N(3))-methyltransferase RlmH [Cytophagaceae bacterium]